MIFLISGGAGFIGSAVIRYIIKNTDHIVVNVDKLTYAGNLHSLSAITTNKRYFFEYGDICNNDFIQNLFTKYQPDVVMHLAAESHVDRSINSADAFIKTNIVGTYTLLEAARHYWLSLTPEKQPSFRFHHVSTDEVYGDLLLNEEPFQENNPYNPNSPYAASKASSDHLVRAWHKTYGLPTVISNCSNNYGPYHFPEKLIPLTIINALQGKPILLYGNGLQIRDWLHVEDHARALYLIATKGKIGENYNIGSNNERSNIDVVTKICSILEENTNSAINYKQLITYTQDRPGHDKRYSINADKIKQQLAWQPQINFTDGIKNTVLWYLTNRDWWQAILDGSYQNNYKQGVQ